MAVLEAAEADAELDPAAMLPLADTELDAETAALESKLPAPSQGFSQGISQSVVGPP